MAEPAGSYTASLDEDHEALAIVAVHVRIDGTLVTVTSLDEPLLLSAGSTLEVAGIDYRLRAGEQVDGKIAFEGYLNKVVGQRIKNDYSDGRNGRSVQSGTIPPGTSAHPGLDGGWKVDVGTESLSLAMVRYANNEAVVEDRIKIRTQVETPDFTIDKFAIRSSNKGNFVGKKVKIYGTWSNQGEGKYKNYAEVDVYHASDPTTLVWVGSLSGVAGPRESVQGEFLQTHADKPYSKRWIPEQSGQYVLKFYADPEDRWSESNEGNNQATLWLRVFDPAKRSNASSDKLKQHHAEDNILPAEATAAAVDAILRTADVSPVANAACKDPVQPSIATPPMHGAETAALADAGETPQRLRTEGVLRRAAVASTIDAVMRDFADEGEWSFRDAMRADL